ncbi:hypothetical protein N9L48_01885 [Psychrosphaera sp.]|nr:hypothetical protein [Psychrosphaera sp.]
MAKGSHLGHIRTRSYQEAYHRIKAIWFKSLIDSADGNYSYGHTQLNDEQTAFTLHTHSEYPKVMVYEVEGRKTPIPLLQERVSASIKTYLVCPYCLRRCQHLLVTETTFACRKCLNAHYASQSECRLTRLRRRIRKLRKGIWGEFCFVDDMFESCLYFPKPDHIQWRTYLKKQREIVTLEQTYWGAFSNSYMGKLLIKSGML